MLTIHDETLAQRITDQAQRQGMTPDEYLAAIIPPVRDMPQTPEEIAAWERQIRADTYAEARAYWARTGNAERLTLSDAELDEQFWTFDDDGTPLLNSDRATVSLPPGHSARLADSAEAADIHVQVPFNAHSAKAYLRAEAAEDIHVTPGPR